MGCDTCRVIGGGGTAGADRAEAGWDFFVSYARADRAWAEWIAWTLEEAGFRVLVQAWDFVPGSNWVAGMNKGVQWAERTVAVLSDAYTRAVYGEAEWQAAWAADPAGVQRRLLPVRVEDCVPPGLLAQIVSADVFGLSQERARARLLDAVQRAVSGRGKPGQAPPFPPDARAMPVRPSFPGGWPGVWNVPARVAHFVGRADLLGQIDRELGGAGAVAVCALRGLGGVGKSALAVEYAHRHTAGFDVVWWIPAEDPELIAGHVAALGVALGLPDGADWPTVRETLRRERLRWLLLLDNVEDPAVVGPFRPTDPFGRLLVTSRRTGLDGFGTQVSVAEFTRAEAVGLLTRRLSGLDPTAAGKIAELLGDLPLAVEQAAGYLTQTGMPADDYVRLLAERLEDTLARGRVADRPGITVANLWELSLTRLRTDQPAAVALLEVCALGAADPIPLDLVSDQVDLLPAGPLRQAAGDVLAWADAVEALVSYGLARRDGSTITVHRLTSAAVRTGMPPSAGRRPRPP